MLSESLWACWCVTSAVHRPPGSPIHQVSIIKDASGSLRVQMDPDMEHIPSTTASKKAGVVGQVVVEADAVCKMIRGHTQQRHMPQPAQRVIRVQLSVW